MGAEFMVNISGKGNTIFSQRLNRFNSSVNYAWEWDFISDVNVAIDTRAMEIQFSFESLGIVQNERYNVWFLTTDWRDANDMTREVLNDTRGVRGTRAKPPGAGSKIKLNEIYPDANGWVELYNTGNKNVDISNWVIQWSGGSYTISAGTTISSGGFLAFDIGSIPDSDTVTLYNDNNQERDSTTYSSVPSGEGWGRYTDGQDNWIFTTPTKAAANQPAAPPPSANVVINEVYPNAAGWVELYNIDTQGGPTDIGGWYITWSGGTYTFPGNAKIQKDSYLAFDIGNIPASDTVELYDNNDVLQDSSTHTNIPSGYGWGRYTDGSGNWWITLPTKAGPNSIPEFSDTIFPLMFTLFIFGFVQHRKKKEKKVKKMVNKRQKTNIMATDNVHCEKLQEVISELVSISDVNGAMVYGANGQVLSWLSENGMEPGQYVNFIDEKILENSDDLKSHYKYGMFSQSIMDYNGFRILVSRIRADLILLLLLDKTAYLGPTMLEMEGCIRQIDGILNIGNT
jgi:predicted regulator of Ras-like GTPase activity (Roadblock/LC7/MglB family)